MGNKTQSAHSASVAATLHRATERLTESSIGERDVVRLDAEILLSHAISKPRSFLYTWPDHRLTEDEVRTFDDLLERRADDYPLAYLTGEQEFWSLRLTVTPEVLIPRADTELLVETALNAIKDIASPRVLELGTGSGAIAIALASERADAQLVAIDNSAQALQIATFNAKRIASDLQRPINISFGQSNWFEQLKAIDPSTAAYDLIVSNPPYIAQNDEHLLESIRFEPQQALTSGVSGLDDLYLILEQAQAHLKPAGSLALEHGYNQGEALRNKLVQAGYKHVATHRDTANHERVTTASIDDDDGNTDKPTS